jgi:thiol:disulfide interchange protein DsbC
MSRRQSHASTAVARAVLLALGLVTALDVAAASAGGAAATEKLRQTLKERYPQVPIVDIFPSTIPGLWEIFTGDSIAYADTAGEHLLVGQMMATATKKNLTAARVDELNRIDVSKIPVDRTIQYKKGNGSRKLYVFSDPDCPFCQQLEKDLATLDDVTVHIVLFPLASLHPDAPAKARSIWCAADRAASWSAWMLEQREPAAAQCPGDPVDALIELGRELRVVSTPTLVFEDGRRFTGAPQRAQLISLLDAKPPPAK